MQHPFYIWSVSEPQHDTFVPDKSPVTMSLTILKLLKYLLKKLQMIILSNLLVFNRLFTVILLRNQVSLNFLLGCMDLM
jgi:hypothetical protein